MLPNPPGVGVSSLPIQERSREGSPLAAEIEAQFLLAFLRPQERENEHVSFTRGGHQKTGFPLYLNHLRWSNFWHFSLVGFFIMQGKPGKV